MRLHSRLPGSPTSCVWNLIVEFTAAQIHLYRGRIYQKVPKTKSLEKSLKSVKNPKQLRSKWYFKLLPSLINARTRGFLDREPALVARQLHHCAFWCHCTAHGLEQPTMRSSQANDPWSAALPRRPAEFRDFFFAATRKDGNSASLLSQKWKKNTFQPHCNPWLQLWLCQSSLSCVLSQSWLWWWSLSLFHTSDSVDSTTFTINIEISIPFTPLKTKMTLEKFPMSNRKYIFIHGGFSCAMVGFPGVRVHLLELR